MIPISAADTQPVSQYATLSGIALLFGGVIGWVLSQWKAAAEIRKLRAERDKLVTEELSKAADLLEKLQSRRDDYSEACRALSTQVEEMLEAIKTGALPENVLPLRSAACAILSDEVVKAFQDWAEFQAIYHKHAPDAMARYYSEQVISEIRRWGDWLNILNHKKFLKSCNPYKFSKSTLCTFFDLLEPLPPNTRATLSPMLSAAVDTLLKA
jgi:hypothetical protein